MILRSLLIWVVCLLCPAVLLAESAVTPAETERWLRDYLRIDTSNPPGNEHLAAAFLADLLHREGIATQLLVTASGRTNLFARLPGRRSGEGLLLVHHMDVVPPGPGWKVEPFAGKIEDGVLWGRGAIDVKSLGIAQLAALISLKRQGVVLERDVALLAVADEESGGGQGAAWLWQHHPEIFAGIAAVINEGGANRKPPAGLLWWGIETAQKRPFWLRVSTTGRGGHGSGLNPHSAMHKLTRALARVLNRPASFRVTDAARQYLGAVAPYDSPQFEPYYRDLDAYVKADGPTGPMLPGVANLFLDTVQLTVIEGGERINVVPARASALLDVRLLPDTDNQVFLEDLRQVLGSGVAIEVLVASPPAAASPTDTRLFAALEAVLSPEAPVVPAFIAGFTDSRFFRERGVTTYGVSPFALGGLELQGIHGANESIPLAEFARGTERLFRVVEMYTSDWQFQD